LFESIVAIGGRSEALKVSTLEPLSQVINEGSLPENVLVMVGSTPQEVAGRIRASGLRWALVDGFSRAGKSRLAAHLAVELGGCAVHLDHFTLPHVQQTDSRRYVDHMDYGRIAKAIESDRPVVVEGVCVRDVLRGRRPDPAFHVYIARVSRPVAGRLTWHDGAEMEDADYVARDDNWLVENTMDYHRRVRPQSNADLIILRVEK
jgi:hypothetical protein